MSAHQAAYDGGDRVQGLTADEMVERRRKQLKLVDCSLPEGMRLTTPQPKQTVMDGLLVWAFGLSFRMADGVEVFHAQRYWPGVAEDVQCAGR